MSIGLSGTATRNWQQVSADICTRRENNASYVRNGTWLHLGRDKTAYIDPEGDMGSLVPRSSMPPPPKSSRRPLKYYSPQDVSISDPTIGFGTQLVGFAVKKWHLSWFRSRPCATIIHPRSAYTNETIICNCIDEVCSLGKPPLKAIHKGRRWRGDIENYEERVMAQKIQTQLGPYPK